MQPGVQGTGSWAAHDFVGEVDTAHLMENLMPWAAPLLNALHDRPKQQGPLPTGPERFSPALQVLRSRLQQRMDARALRYTGVGDVIKKTLQVGCTAGCRTLS